MATTLFRLTDAGAELEPVLYAIGRWGIRYMMDKTGLGVSQKGAHLSIKNKKDALHVAFYVKSGRFTILNEVLI